MAALNNYIQEIRLNLQKAIQQPGSEFDQLKKFDQLELDTLTPEELAEVLRAQDDSGRNALLSAVYFNNLGMLKSLVDKAMVLEMKFIAEMMFKTYYSTLIIDNDILQEAALTRNHELMDYIVDLFNPEDAVLNQSYDFMQNMRATLKTTHYRALYVQAGFRRVLAASVQQKKVEFTEWLLQMYYQFTPGEDYPTWVSYMFTEDLRLNQSQTHQYGCLLAIMTEIPDYHIQVQKQFVEKIPTNQLHEILLSNHENKKMCPLSILIENDCETIIKNIFNIREYTKNFYASFDYEWLSNHRMRLPMIEILAPHCWKIFPAVSKTIKPKKVNSDRYYLVPVPIYGECQPVALFFYTEKQLPRRKLFSYITLSPREGATTKYDIICKSMQRAGFRVWNICEGKGEWKKEDLKCRLKYKLDSIKEWCSMLVTVAMCHGDEESIYDSYGYEISIVDDLITSIHENTEKFIPKVRTSTLSVAARLSNYYSRAAILVQVLSTLGQ